MTTTNTEAFIEKATQVYKELCSIPSITRGTLHINSCDKNEGTCGITITSTWSQRDLNRKENKTFKRNHLVTYSFQSKELGPVQEPSFPSELQHVQLMCRSPSGEQQVIVRKLPATKKDEEKQFIEIWSFNNLVKSIDIKAADKHGDIYEDSQFGSLQWSPSEKRVLYVAEKKKAKKASYFDSNNQDETSPTTKPEKGFQFDYEESWGELLAKKHHPVLAVLDIETGNISIVDGIPDDLSVGQAIWSPGGAGIVFTGWWHEPYRLGVIHCTNRRSGIFHVSLDGQHFEQLSKPECAVLCPRFNPQMNKLVYLARDTKGVHMCCLRLIEFDWKSKKTTTIVDIVDYPKEDGFPGIYSTGLPQKCWSSDGKMMIFESFWGSASKILLIDLESKSVSNLTEESGCWNVLHVQEDIILASFSSPSNSHQLMMAPLSLTTGNAALKWTVVAKPVKSHDIKWEVIAITPEDQQKGSKEDYEAVLIEPSNPGLTKPQLIVHPHGGPHSTYPASYMIYYAALCRLGFAVLSVNYRGSVGFGQKVLESLPGNIGSQDVQEVKLAVDRVVQTDKFSTDDVFLLGGSHGGFLACHLAGQYPDFFRAVVMRNPVINLVTLIGTSDIPDWGLEEIACDFDYELLTDTDTCSKLLAHSPIIHANKIVAPVMLMLGELDLRVPPPQGKELYRTLKARGVEVRLIVYPDNSHPLNKVEAESDAFINISRWFHEHQSHK